MGVLQPVVTLSLACRRRHCPQRDNAVARIAGLHGLTPNVTTSIRFINWPSLSLVLNPVNQVLALLRLSIKQMGQPTNQRL